MFKKIKEWWVWMTSKRVLEAINNDLPYEDVCKIVEEEMAK